MSTTLASLEASTAFRFHSTINPTWMPGQSFIDVPYQNIYWTVKILLNLGDGYSVVVNSFSFIYLEV